MTILSKILPLACLLFSSFDNDCGLLPNGHYQITYTFHSKEADSRVEIENNRFYQYWENGPFAKGRILWLSACTFEFDYFFNKSAEDTTELGKRIMRSFGDMCIELKEKKGDTVLFRTTYTRNLHITVNRGMLVKLN